ncbi:MAG: hypothetical protein JXA67_21200 [Micromonosporaceae bacterium]|nr:hypothetical protein [Micromonosporaceae bacterium]
MASSIVRLRETSSTIGVNAEEARSRAQAASALTAQASEQVASLEKIGHDVLRAVETITAIARQTNMLALNATIEAARAGDAGAGFAIVAREVKELAQETAASAKKITETIQRVTEAVGATAAQFAGINTSLAEIDAFQRSVGEAITEQYSDATAIAKDIEQAVSLSSDVVSLVKAAGA